MYSSSLLKTDPGNESSSVARLLGIVLVAALHVILKMRVGETTILGNCVLTVSICLEVALVINITALFKRDPRNVTSGVEQVLGKRAVAVLHVLLKACVGETKKLGNGVLSLSIGSNMYLEMLSKSVFKTDPGNESSSVERFSSI